MAVKAHTVVSLFMKTQVGSKVLEKLYASFSVQVLYLNMEAHVFPKTMVIIY
jgi:hypothetical protein